MGVALPPIGLGGAWLGWSPDGLDAEVGVRTVLRALELGVTFIDTSGGYLKGESERIIGRALAEWYAAGGRREDLVLSTKTGTRYGPRNPYAYSAEGTLESVRESLSLLGTDYLDILLVHDPFDVDLTLAPGSALDTLVSLREQGVVRAVGLGFRDHESHRRYIGTGRTDVCLTHSDYNLLRRTAGDGVIAPAYGAGVAVLNASLTAGGLLTGSDPRAELARRGARKDLDPAVRERIVGDAERAVELWDWCRSRRTDIVALNFGFSLRDRRVASTLFGASTPEIVSANVSAASAVLPEDVWNDLEDFLGELSPA